MPKDAVQFVLDKNSYLDKSWHILFKAYRFLVSLQPYVASINARNHAPVNS